MKLYKFELGDQILIDFAESAVNPYGGQASVQYKLWNEYGQLDWSVIDRKEANHILLGSYDAIATVSLI